MRLRVGDPVIVTSGNEKGKEGSVKAIKNDKIVIQGVNKRKKHQKPTGDKKKGTILEIEAPLNISNVRYCANGKGVKLRARFSEGEENKKEIYYKTKDGEEKVVRTL